MNGTRAMTERPRVRRRSVTAWGAHTIAVAGAITLGACNFDVVNPGPILDDSLNNLTGHASVVNGLNRNLADALDQIAYWVGALSFEITPAGSTGSYGITSNVQEGTLDPDDGNGDWNRAQRARWTAEDAIRRFQAVYEAAAYDKTIFVAQAALAAGYANRLLGENMCEAVYDGGPAEAHTTHFPRAEAHFTEVKRVAANIIADAAIPTATRNTARRLDSAATAARASVRASLASFNNNNAATWATAAADAATIANAFRYTAAYTLTDLDSYNFIQWGSSVAARTAGSPYRAHSIWGTYHEQFGTTFDTRVPWNTTTLTGDAAVSKFAGLRVPWYPQAKYTSQSSPISLSSGWEMRLIQAEEALVRGDLSAATGFMNQRRANIGRPNVAPATITEGWTELKRERMYELWLEGRRLGDLRRWAAANSPGTTFDGLWVDEANGLPGGTKDNVWTQRETMTSPRVRSVCWPIGRSERETNPNIP
jgi:hypothetical protein